MSKIFVSKQRELYNPRCHIPQQPFWLIHTPKLCCNRPQVPVLVSDCFLLYPFHLETNRWEQLPLSNPMDAPLPLSLLPVSYITSSEQDLPSCFATAPMRTPRLSLMRVMLADPLQYK